jgi:hypothetical protein
MGDEVRTRGIPTHLWNDEVIYLMFYALSCTALSTHPHIAYSLPDLLPMHCLFVACSRVRELSSHLVLHCPRKHGEVFGEY